MKYLLFLFLTSCIIITTHSSNITGTYSVALTHDTANPGSCPTTSATTNGEMIVQANDDNTALVQLDFLRNQCVGKLDDNTLTTSCELTGDTQFGNAQITMHFYSWGFEGYMSEVGSVCSVNYLMRGLRN